MGFWVSKGTVVGESVGFEEFSWSMAPKAVIVRHETEKGKYPWKTRGPETMVAANILGTCSRHVGLRASAITNTRRIRAGNLDDW